MSTEEELLGCDAVELNVVEDRHDKKIHFSNINVALGIAHN